MPPPASAGRRPIGAHAPAARGLGTGALRYAAAVRAEAIQVFVTNPRAWALSPGRAEQTAALREHVTETGLPVFVHAPYLVNVASPDTGLRLRSAAMVRHCLRRGAEIGALGVVMHAGSATTTTRAHGLAAIRETLLPLLDTLPDRWPDLLIEPMAGTGGMLCAAIGEIGPYLAALDWHPRARLCLDTCHLFAAGHDLTADGGVAAAMTALHAVAPGRRADPRQRQHGRLRFPAGPASERRPGHARPPAVLGPAASPGHGRRGIRGGDAGRRGRPGCRHRAAEAAQVGCPGPGRPR